MTDKKEECLHEAYRVVMDGSEPKCTKCGEVIGCSTGTCRVPYCKTCFPKEGDVKIQEDPKLQEAECFCCCHHACEGQECGSFTGESRCSHCKPQDSGKEKCSKCVGFPWTCGKGCVCPGCEVCNPEPQSWEANLDSEMLKFMQKIGWGNDNYAWVPDVKKFIKDFIRKTIAREVEKERHRLSDHIVRRIIEARKMWLAKADNVVMALEDVKNFLNN